ncbi:MAG: hypothetical protein ABIQ38_00895 [Ilumatobacteraceae bacterium]
MPSLKALVAALGIGASAKKRVLRKTVKRWGGLWTLFVVFDIIRYLHRRDRKVIARRVIRDGEVLVVTSTVDRKKS